MRRGIIFDMDGCLIDSKEVQKTALFESYRLVVGDDKCPTYEDYIKYTGDSIDNVLKKLGLPKEMAPTYRKLSCELVSKVIVNHELMELIKKFRKYGFLISINTGKEHSRAIDILNYYGINELFDIVVGSDEVKNPKPNPDSIMYAIDGMNASKDNVVMIGDGQNDILSAKSAGVRSILTRWYGDSNFVVGADYVVNTVDELQAVLKVLFDL